MPLSSAIYLGTALCGDARAARSSPAHGPVKRGLVEVDTDGSGTLSLDEIVGGPSGPRVVFSFPFSQILVCWLIEMLLSVCVCVCACVYIYISLSPEIHCYSRESVVLALGFLADPRSLAVRQCS